MANFQDLLLNGGTSAPAPAIVLDAANTGSYAGFGGAAVTADAAVGTTIAAKVTEGNVYKTAFKFVDPTSATGADLPLKTNAQVKLAIGADGADLAGVKVWIKVGTNFELLFNSSGDGAALNTTHGSFAPATGVLTLNALTHKTLNYSGIVVETGIKADAVAEIGESLSVTLSQVDNKFVNSWYVNKTVLMADKVIPDTTVGYSITSMAGTVGKDTFVLSGAESTMESTKTATITGFDATKDLIKLPDTGVTAITNNLGFTSNVDNPIQFANLGDLTAAFTLPSLKDALANLDGLNLETKGFVFAIQLNTTTTDLLGVSTTTPDTYLLADANGDGIYQATSDLFVKLAGVSSSALNLSNFIDA